MKPVHTRTASLLAVLALLATGCQREAEGGTASGTPEPTRTAGRWQVSYTGGLDTEITDLAVLPGDEGWAIETRYAEEDDTGSATLLRRAGGTWRKATPPPGTAGSELTAVEASAPDNVWVFGERPAGDGPGDGAFAFRWDGARWTGIDVPAPVLTAGSLLTQTVAVTAPDDVWMLGEKDEESRLHHWNGSRWTTTDPPGYLNALTATGPDDVWAVGGRSDGERTYGQPATLHWDGVRWHQRTVPEYRFPDGAPEEYATLNGVYAVSPDEVWATGEHTFNHGEVEDEPQDENILLRWDGERWRALPARPTGKMAFEAGPDGAGGVILNRAWRWTAGGALRAIGRHTPVPGLSGEVVEADREQRFWPEKILHVPGESRVWGAGVIELGASEHAFSRGAVLTYDAGGGTG